MCVRFDPDEAAECAPGAVVERVFIKEIARGVRRDVILQCARIKLLSAVCDRNSEQVAASAFADETAETFEARIFSAKMQIQAHGRRVVIYDCGIHLQGDDVGPPVLRAYVSHFRARAGNQVVDPAGKSRRLWVYRAEMLDHGDLRELVCDQEMMRQQG